jgi:hypothetical protein
MVDAQLGEWMMMDVTATATATAVTAPVASVATARVATALIATAVAVTVRSGAFGAERLRLLPLVKEVSHLRQRLIIQ